MRMGGAGRLTRQTEQRREGIGVASVLVESNFVIVGAAPDDEIIRNRMEAIRQHTASAALKILQNSCKAGDTGRG